jgi:hypothetical protein
MNLPTPPSFDGSNRSWAELHVWAYHNHPGWQQTFRVAERQGLTEVEAFRRLASVLLSECCERRNQQIQQAARESPTFVVPIVEEKS